MAHSILCRCNLHHWKQQPDEHVASIEGDSEHIEVQICHQCHQRRWRMLGKHPWYGTPYKWIYDER